MPCALGPDALPTPCHGVTEGGPDPNGNMRLSSALVRARAANMPKDSLERSMKAGMSGGECCGARPRGGQLLTPASLRSAAGDDLETLQYEAHGPGGVAYIMDVLTDNKNRTVAELRHLFKEAGGASAARPCCRIDAVLTAQVPAGLRHAADRAHGCRVAGALGAAGSASWMFDHVAALTVRGCRPGGRLVGAADCKGGSG